MHFLCCSLTWRRWRERVVTTASVSSWPQPMQCLISSTCVSWTLTRSPTKSVWQASSVLLVSVSISLYTGSSKIVETGLSACKVIVWILVRISLSFTWSLSVFSRIAIQVQFPNLDYEKFCCNEYKDTVSIIMCKKSINELCFLF